jgi:SAM-dependent methyltransferase
VGKLSGQAAEADRYELYQQSVQAPDADVEFFERVFREHRNQQPMTLREDFAGTAYLSAAWVESHPDRRAIAVDIDTEPLRWGREHNLSDDDLRSRVELINSDVSRVTGSSADIVAAPNFSICLLEHRSELLEYLSAARSALKPGGMFICELYGGTEAIIATTEERDYDDFSYVWEQESYNPIDHRTRCHIHFDFPDGTRLERAFSYRFRLWTIAEMVEALEDSGFEAVKVYWEGVDDDGTGTGDYRLTVDEENQEGWLVYIVALA